MQNALVDASQNSMVMWTRWTFHLALAECRPTILASPVDLRDKVRLEVQRYPEEPKPWTVFRRVWEETIQTYPVIQRITGYIHDTQIGKLANVCRSCILIVVTKIAKRRGVELPNSYSTLNNRRVSINIVIHRFRQLPNAS